MNTHNYTDEQLQAAIDAAFPVVNRPYDPNLGTEKDAPLWRHEAPSRLAIARTFLAALPQAEPSVSTEGAPATSDPYARLKAYNDAGARIRCAGGQWWKGPFIWNWNEPLELYEVHPDDLHMVPEYAPAKPWTLPAPSAEPPQAQPTQSPQDWTPRPGDVVRLKSGGPEMTVTKTISSESVEIIGYAGGKFWLEILPIPALQPAKEEARP